MSLYTVTHAGKSTRLHAACACTSVKRFSEPHSERKYERSRPFQITHLYLDLDVNFEDKAVSGSATMHIERRAATGTHLTLDAVGFSLQRLSLEFGGGKAKRLELGRDYSYDGDEIVVSLPAELLLGVLRIEYRAVPRLGLYFLEPDEEVPHRPRQVWSQCQDEDGQHWFPCQDKPHVKMTYEMRARVPKGMTVLSGGELLEKSTPARGPWEFHYKLDVPTPAYLVTLVVGEFDEWEESVALPSGRVIPLRYLVPKGAAPDGKRAFHRTGEAIRLFSEKTGVEYPFARYTQVVVADFIFGGMENTTATTMYEHILIDKVAALDIDSYDLVAHELAHQWFGDLVTCRDWSHAWLNEGFATYFEHVEREHRLGLDEYEDNVTADLDIYLGEARSNYQRPIVCRDYDEPIELFDRHLYQKGGLVLHMLRRLLGDDAFWRSIKTYLESNRGGIVETNDLMRTLEEVSGISLEKFFDQWIYRPGHPEISIKVGYTEDLLTVDIEQTQNRDDVATFELPFEVDVTIAGETKRHRRTITEKKASIVVRSSVRPDHITIDPQYLIAAPFALRAPADMLRNLLKKGERARARRMAARALGHRHDIDTVSALIECLENKSEAWMVRAKAAESLGKIRGPEAEEALISAREIDDPKVRKAVTTALGTLRTTAAEKALVNLTKDKSYLVSAAAARALGTSKNVEVPQLLTRLLKKDSWSEVVRSGALAALAETGSDDAIEPLMEWTAYGKPLRARRAAIAALPKVGEGRRVRQHLTRILTDRDPHVRRAALNALSELDDQKASEDIEKLIDRELDGGVRALARTILTDLGKGRVSGVRQAKKESQKLKREVDELKLRIQKIEQLVDGGSLARASAKKATEGSTTEKKASAKKAGAKKASSKPAKKSKRR